MAGRNFHPDELAAAYDFLRATPPFRRWKLPPSDDLAFHVTANKNECGAFIVDGAKLTICISAELTAHTFRMIEIMAHEILHLHQHLAKHCTKAEHNADFRAKAKRICAIHGFDPKSF